MDAFIFRFANAERVRRRGADSMEILREERIPNEFIPEMKTRTVTEQERRMQVENVWEDTIFPGLYLPYYGADDLIGYFTIR